MVEDLKIPIEAERLPLFCAGKDCFFPVFGRNGWEDVVIWDNADRPFLRQEVSFRQPGKVAITGSGRRPCESRTDGSVYLSRFVNCPVGCYTVTRNVSRGGNGYGNCEIVGHCFDTIWLLKGGKDKYRFKPLSVGSITCLDSFGRGTPAVAPLVMDGQFGLLLFPAETSTDPDIFDQINQFMPPGQQ